MHSYLDIYEPAVLARAEALLDEIYEAISYEFSYGGKLRRMLRRPAFQRLALEVLADEELIEEKGWDWIAVSAARDMVIADDLDRWFPTDFFTQEKTYVY